jgi:tocopherol cyclase
MYHGWGRRRRYFEGWYYKLVSADESRALAVIPGISMDQSGGRQAFVQVMDGKRFKADFFRFPGEAFTASDRTFEIRVGDNCFSRDRISLDLPGLSGELTFHQTTPWPRMLGAPGIMGWFSFVPFMECWHGVVSLDHRLEGTVRYQGEDIDFTGGRGYTEKDWGRSFPRAYVWMQTNHFQTEARASLIASVAHIPWLGSYFIGFICGFWLEGRLFRFATYTGAKKYLEIGEDAVGLVFKNPGSELRIRARQAPGAALFSPLSGEMTGKVNESLQAVIEVELLENGRRIFEGTGRNAGLEIAGQLDLLR